MLIYADICWLYVGYVRNMKLSNNFFFKFLMKDVFDHLLAQFSINSKAAYHSLFHYAELCKSSDN